jgi:hypothetical protein
MEGRPADISSRLAMSALDPASFSQIRLKEIVPATALVLTYTASIDPKTRGCLSVSRQSPRHCTDIGSGAVRARVNNAAVVSGHIHQLHWRRSRSMVVRVSRLKQRLFGLLGELHRPRPFKDRPSKALDANASVAIVPGLVPGTTSR